MKVLFSVMLAWMMFALPLSPASHAKTSLPVIKRAQLPNGLQVLMLPNRANPFVELQFVAKVGAALDPAGKEGLADFTATMLTNGTPSRSEEVIAETIEAIGARLSAGASYDSFELGGSVVTLDKNHLTTFLDVFADVLRNASFPESSLEKTRALRVAALKRLADRHSALADRAFRMFLYRDAPRGRATTLTSLNNLMREDLVAYRDRVLIPQHAVLAIAGDFDEAAMMNWVKTHLGDMKWGQGVCRKAAGKASCAALCLGEECSENPLAETPHQPPKKPMVKEVREILLVDRNDPSINQIQWRMGQDNPVTLLHPTWGPFRLGTQILGGDFTARLNTTLRVREGLTYGARFRVDYGARDSGPMRVSTFVAPKDLSKAIDLSLKEIANVTGAPLDTAEIDNFKAKLINAFPFKFETVSHTLDQYLALALEDVPVSWLENYTDALKAPNATQIHEALQTIEPMNMVLVAVGNQDLIPILTPYGRVHVVTADALIADGLQDMSPAQKEPKP